MMDKHVSDALESIERKMKSGQSLMEVEEALKRHIRREFMKIWYAIVDERREQDLKWGGEEHDDKHTTQDWSKFIIDHVQRLPENPRYQMVRVAALAIAAIESMDRKQNG